MTPERDGPYAPEPTATPFSVSRVPPVKAGHMSIEVARRAGLKRIGPKALLAAVAHLSRWNQTLMYLDAYPLLRAVREAVGEADAKAALRAAIDHGPTAGALWAVATAGEQRYSGYIERAAILREPERSTAKGRTVLA